MLQPLREEYVSTYNHAWLRQGEEPPPHGVYVHLGHILGLSRVSDSDTPVGWQGYLSHAYRSHTLTAHALTALTRLPLTRLPLTRLPTTLNHTQS